MDAIQLQPASGKSISATGTSAAVEVGATSSRAWVAVADGGTAHVSAGDSGVAAVVATDLPCLDGAYVPITIPEGATHIAAITSGASVTLWLYPLQGQRA